MNSDKSSPSTFGAFNSYTPPRANSLQQARQLAHEGHAFAIRPGGAQTSIFEGVKTQIAYSQGKVWNQYFAASSTGESTKYENIFANIGVKDLTRANKAFVAGNSQNISPPRDTNTWKQNSYSDSGLLGAALIRINESITAFGTQSMGHPAFDAGTGIMAEALSRKWAARTAWQSLDSKKLLRDMTAKFPQLKSVDEMRKKSSESMLSNQIQSSLMEAAITAGDRALEKKISDVGGYVQHKFNKHGLGPVPGGWAEALKQRRGIE